MQSHESVQVQLVAQPAQEVAKVLLFGIAPLEFAQGVDAWHHLPLHLGAVLGPFSPYTSLYTYYVVRLFRSEPVRYGFEVVDTLHARHAFQTVISGIAEIKMADRAYYSVVT